jgi:hypothetical protein
VEGRSPTHKHRVVSNHYLYLQTHGQQRWLTKEDFGLHTV